MIFFIEFRASMDLNRNEQFSLILLLNQIENKL